MIEIPQRTQKRTLYTPWKRSRAEKTDILQRGQGEGTEKQMYSKRSKSRGGKTAMRGQGARTEKQIYSKDVKEKGRKNRCTPGGQRAGVEKHI